MTEYFTILMIFILYTLLLTKYSTNLINTNNMIFSQFEKWLSREERKRLIKPRVLDSANSKNLEERVLRLRKWKEVGGVLLIGYEMFRLLAAKGHARHKKAQEEEEEEEGDDEMGDVRVQITCIFWYKFLIALM
tara:strand:+ start:194 stop:595 length:402 start_codon:yes stop_codon:yes gene_type:complete